MGGWPRACALVAAILLACPASAADRWVAAWSSAQMPATGDNALPDGKGPLTLRQIVRPTIGSKRVRIRFSNAFGREPLVIAGAAVARAAATGTARIVTGTTMPLRFGTLAAVTIPAGADIYSDPVTLPVAAGDDLAVSLSLPSTRTAQTGHPGARATSFLTAGDRVSHDTLAGAEPRTHWCSLADVEVEADRPAATIVAIGDSITDGYGVAPDSNARWTDVLARRLIASPDAAGVGVVNAGIGGNRMLLDGLGPNLLARFDRDVIARSGVGWAILLAGVNDLGVLTRDAPVSASDHAVLVARLKQGYAELAARARARHPARSRARSCRSAATITTTPARRPRRTGRRSTASSAAAGCSRMRLPAGRS